MERVRTFFVYTMLVLGLEKELVTLERCRTVSRICLVVFEGTVCAGVMLF